MIYYCAHCDQYRDSDHVIAVADPEDSENLMCEEHEETENE